MLSVTYAESSFMMSFIMLSVTYNPFKQFHYAECRSADCHLAECRGAFIYAHVCVIPVKVDANMCVNYAVKAL